MKKRSCHDIIFIVLFIAFWVGMFYIAGVAVKNGNPARFIYGVDYYGNVCGTNNIAKGEVPADKAMDFSNSQYLYFILNSTAQRGYIDVCVPSCPNTTYLTPTSADEVICPYNVTPTYELGFVVPPCYGKLESGSLLHRCIPLLNEAENATTEAAQAAINALNLQEAADMSLKVFGTLIRAWPYIAVAGAGALVLSFVWVALVSKIAGFLVYFTIVGVHVAIIGLCYLVYNELQTVENNYSSTPIYLRLVSQKDLIDALKGIFSVLVIVGVFVLLATICMWTRIAIAIGIIKEASKAVLRIPTIFLVPIGVGISLIPLVVYWFYIGAYLGTIGKPQYDADGNFTGYDTDNVYIRMQIYHLFGGFWTLNFLQAMGDVIIAGAIASWYWVHDKAAIPPFPVASALWRTLRYNVGSVLFGSLVLAFVQTIRVILKFIVQQTKGRENRMVKCMLKIVECLVACFERFIKFLNHNAYIMVSIYGYSFCTGARRGMVLITTNILRVTAVHCVSAYVIFLGKLFVCIVTTLIAFIVLRNEFDSVGDYVIPTIAIAILAYAVAVAFFSVFDMAIDTLLLCFCEDTDRNNGADRPYYMSDHLKKHIDTDAKGCGCC